MSEEKKSRICQECQMETTGRMRRGPGGPQTLCNRCGLRYYRKQRALKKKATPPPAPTSQQPYLFFPVPFPYPGNQPLGLGMNMLPGFYPGGAGFMPSALPPQPPQPTGPAQAFSPHPALQASALGRPFLSALPSGFDPLYLHPGQVPPPLMPDHLSLQNPLAPQSHSLVPAPNNAGPSAFQFPQSNPSQQQPGQGQSQSQFQVRRVLAEEFSEPLLPDPSRESMISDEVALLPF
jgi:hypothetical protein